MTLEDSAAVVTFLEIEQRQTKSLDGGEVLEPDDLERLRYDPADGAPVGLAAPVTRLLRKLGALVD